MNKRIAGFALVLLAGALAQPALAQTGNWRVDNAHSAGKVSVDDQAVAGRINVLVGGAGVSGSLHLDRTDVSKSTFEFTAAPADATADRTTGRDGKPTTQIHFRSKNVSWTDEGRLKVTGTLTVTRVTFDGQLDANEGYSGPVYAQRSVSHASREETLILPVPANAEAGAAFDGNVLLRVNREDFPEFLTAVLSTSWPPIAQGTQCQAQPSASEDYSGTLCTGSQVIVPYDTRTVAAASEDYPGDGANSATAGNVVTVALHLHLVPRGGTLSAKAGGQ